MQESGIVLFVIQYLVRNDYKRAMISIGTTSNTGRGASLQEEIDFGDNIHPDTDARTQLANGYGGASQGLPLDHQQVIKARVIVTSSQSVS